MQENTEFILSRDCEVIQIPSGNKITIPGGTPGVITQTLGGSYTIATYQGLARVSEKDLDALGLEKPQQTDGTAKPSGSSNGTVDEKAVWDQLRQCFDPEIPVNIVDLGLVYDCVLEWIPADNAYRIQVKMTLTAPGCGMGPAIVQDVRDKLFTLKEIIEADVALVFDPPWNQGMMSEAAQLQLGML